MAEGLQETGYGVDIAFCRQCKADLIGPPGGEACGTCGLPASAVLPSEQKAREQAEKKSEATTPAPVSPPPAPAAQPATAQAGARDAGSGRRGEASRRIARQAE